MPSITVVGEAAQEEEAVRMAQESDPDVILMDQEQFESDGPKIIRLVWKESPDTGILILADYGLEEEARLDKGLGALRYAQNNISPEHLARLIQEISRNGSMHTCKK